MDLSSLQNGSDIRGVALNTLGGKPVNLTPKIAAQIGMAFSAWLSQKTGKKHPAIAIGRDSRLTGESLLNHIAGGITHYGATATSFGMASTPAMFMSTVTEGFMFDGAVMITASHLPPERNGFKFFTKNGGLEKRDITAILQQAAQYEDMDIQPYEPKYVDFMSVYCQRMIEYIRQSVNDKSDYMHPLRNLHIVIDAGNGAGGFFADKILLPLGADISGSQFLNPDGTFPSHSPNPEDSVAMQSISNAVRASHADLGIIFDPDVDRAAIVLSDGREINRNRLIAMLSSVILRDHPNSVIVTDSITSTGLNQFITKHGGTHRRFKRGYRNVINEAIRLNETGSDCWLAIETSGHGAMKENYFLDDGAYIAAKLLVECALCNQNGSTIDSLIEGLNEPVEAVEIRLNINDSDFAGYGKTVIEKVTHFCMNDPRIIPESENYEGIRCNVPEFSGWFLLRMSLHDPVMPLNIESDITGGVSGIKSILASLLEPFDKLDVM